MMWQSTAAIAIACSLAIMANTFTNTKIAHLEEALKDHSNPDLVGYTATTDTPDFHFRRIRMTSAATEFTQVSVKFYLNKLHRHMTAISTTI